MQLFDNECLICCSEENLEEHHISYKEDETVVLCASCHSKVHQTDGFYDHLKPELSRKEANKKGYINESAGVTYSVYVANDTLVDVIDKLVETDEYYNQSHLFIKGLKEEIGYKD